MFLRLPMLAAMAALPFAAHAADLPIPIVAAENFYGEAAEAIGGDRVKVESIVIGGDTDPHDFDPSPSTARLVADARIVIMNGIDYDPWMARLAEASTNPDRVLIDVGDLLGGKIGDNPHLWYNPQAIPALADALVEALTAADPAGKAEYENRRNAFVASLDPLSQKIGEIKGRFAGVKVTASEPVFGLMAEALGLDMLDKDFQQAIMAEAEPSASSIARINDDLRSGRAKVLFYNSQVVDPMTERLIDSAKAGGVPIVGVTETKPQGKTYSEWMLDELDATAKALAAPAS